MKKFFAILLVCITCIGLLSLTASAEAPTASLAGPQVVRAGDRITLNYIFRGDGIVAVMGDLVYNPTQLTLVSADMGLGGTWGLENNGNRYMAVDNALTSPISGEVVLLGFTFQVADLAEGTAVQVGFQNVTASTLTEEFTLVDSTYAVTISRPLSGNNALGSLSIGNATLSPAFDPNLTRYSVEVPFSVTHLDITATAADGNATVSVYNPQLEEDRTNTVTVTVTAENGTTKEYVILAKRGKDPNYEPGSNNNLSDIVVEEFRLSPVFRKDITEYLIWLPYEVDSVHLTGIAEDKYASITVEGGSGLKAGADNEIRITCTAENGQAKVYTVIAKRAPSHEDMKNPTIPTVPTDPTQPSRPASSGTAPYTRPTNGYPNDDAQAQRNKLLVVLYSVLGVLAVAGIVVCILFVMATKKVGKYADESTKNKKNNR